jgi:hypothetical protein
MQPPHTGSGTLAALILLSAGAGAAVAGLRACRLRVIALGLSLTLGLFSMETAVHSVHHLADPETATTCPVLCAAEHLAWGAVPAPATEAPPLCVAAAPLLRRDEGPQSAIYRPHQGRAPPA